MLFAILDLISSDDSLKLDEIISIISQYIYRHFELFMEKNAILLTIIWSQSLSYNSNDIARV